MDALAKHINIRNFDLTQPMLEAVVMSIAPLIRSAALEEAARVADEIDQTYDNHDLRWGVQRCAERIRALGVAAPGTYREFAKLTVIKESEGKVSAEDMIKQLVAGQEAVTKTARSLFPIVDKAGDEPTADLLTQRMQIHEKNAWMLRSLLEN